MHMDFWAGAVDGMSFHGRLDAVLDFHISETV